MFQAEVREVAEGERVQFKRYDEDLGVQSGELGTVTRIGHDNSMTVKLDFGKTAEVSPEKSRHIDYGYAVESPKEGRADWVIATGDFLTRQVFQGASPKADLTLYTGNAAADQEFSAAEELASPEVAQPAEQQHDFGIGF